MPHTVLIPPLLGLNVEIVVTYVPLFLGHSGFTFMIGRRIIVFEKSARRECNVRINVGDFMKCVIQLHSSKTDRSLVIV
jgi:hypothetical protein